MKINNTDLVTHRDIEANISFYRTIFEAENPQKQYLTLTVIEKEAWKATVKENYSEWLSPAVSEKADILEKLYGWLKQQNFISFLSEVETGIVNSHRNPLDWTQVNLDKTVRSKNTAYIGRLEQENERIIEEIKNHLKIMP